MGDEKRVWGIHTQDDLMFLNSNVIALGWPKMGNLSKIKADRKAYKDAVEEVYPNMKKRAIPTSAGMLYRFANEVEIGDYIVYPSKIDRMINIGVVESEYKYVPTAIEYVQQRKIKWLGHYPRTTFSQGALYEIGSALSFFSVKNYAEEYLSIAGIGKTSTPSIIIQPPTITAEAIIENTKDYIIKTLSKNLKGYDFEGFVANLLNAMGYRTIVSLHGGDKGIDIVAYKDELPPRIVVQVKSIDGDIKESILQSFRGAMKPGDYGLFVTLSNYTKNAKQYLGENPMIRGINGIELVELVLKYYEDLDEKYREMIPLKMTYIPVVEETDETME